MRLPKLEQFGLPIDFSGTREALATNLKTRSEARRLLSEGVTLVIFQGGGVFLSLAPVRVPMVEAVTSGSKDGVERI